MQTRRRLLMQEAKRKHNYLNGVGWTDGYFISDRGTYSSHDKGHYSDLVTVVPSNSYELAGYSESSPLWDRIHGYDANGQWLRQIEKLDWIGAFSDVIDIPADCYYIRISTEKATQISMYDA